MRTIKDLINEYMQLNNMTRDEASSLACQHILINKISSSSLVNKILLKGGVVMYNMTKDTRRATRDMDFDVIRFDISNVKSIKNLINCFNKRDCEYHVIMINHKKLNQDDYRGVRIFLKIKDKSMSVKFKIDVGVHTLFAIEQSATNFCFDKHDKKKLKIKINPPEQMIAEKLYALAKIGPTTGRIRDIYDIYYLLDNCDINKNICKKCFELLTLNSKHNLKDINDISNRINDVLNDDEFKKRAEDKKENWLNIDFDIVKREILDFIYNL